MGLSYGRADRLLIAENGGFRPVQFRKLVSPELDAYFYKLSLPMIKRSWLCGMYDTPEHLEITRLNERNGEKRVRRYIVRSHLALSFCHSASLNISMLVIPIK